MKRCWASVIGGCSKKLSKEHYVSKGLWAGEKVLVVSGFDWLKGEEKSIPLTALTAKILCAEHNTLLSPLDSVAVKFVQQLDELERVLTARWKTKQKNILNIRRHHVNGTHFERWAAKTLIGCLYANRQDGFWYQTQKRANEPSNEIVKAIYGLSYFTKPMGLYFAYDEEAKGFFKEGISVEPLLCSGGELLGGLLSFRGFRFYVWLTDEVRSLLRFQI